MYPSKCPIVIVMARMNEPVKLCCSPNLSGLMPLILDNMVALVAETAITLNFNISYLRDQ